MPALPKSFEVQAITPRKFKLPKGPGRPKGAVGKVVRDLKVGCLEAAANLGRDGRGENGLVGYLEWLGAQHPRAFAGLLAKLLPHTIAADVSTTSVSSIRIVSVDSGTFLSKEDCAKFSQPLPLQIEAEAIASHDAEPENFERDFVEPEPTFETEPRAGADRT